MQQAWLLVPVIHTARRDHRDHTGKVVGLPRECCTKDVGVQIANSFQSWYAIEIRVHEDEGKKFIRLRAEINVMKPIRRGVKVQEKPKVTRPRETTDLIHVSAAVSSVSRWELINDFLSPLK